MTAITAFLFIPFILILVIFVILRKLSKNTKKFWTPKRIIIVIAGYITLGFLAFLYFAFFYESKLTVLADSERKQLESELKSLQRYDQEYNSSYLTKAYIKNTWEFKFEGDTLPVSIQEGGNGLSFDIRLRYNDDIEKGKAVISYYQFPVIIDGLNMADQIPLPIVYMTQEQLFIEPPLENKVSYNRIKASLGIVDFNREVALEPSISLFHYSSVLLIDVARNTELEDLQGRVTYIR